tara:strand:+ start:152 stop:262 length:111 start_codon:yes stop_codon:yes gene_type:complete
MMLLLNILLLQEVRLVAVITGQVVVQVGIKLLQTSV